MWVRTQWIDTGRKRRNTCLRILDKRLTHRRKCMSDKANIFWDTFFVLQALAEFNIKRGKHTLSFVECARAWELRQISKIGWSMSRLMCIFVTKSSSFSLFEVERRRRRAKFSTHTHVSFVRSQGWHDSFVCSFFQMISQCCKIDRPRNMPNKNIAPSRCVLWMLSWCRDVFVRKGTFEDSLLKSTVHHPSFFFQDFRSKAWIVLNIRCPLFSTMDTRTFASQFFCPSTLSLSFFYQGLIWILFVICNLQRNIGCLSSIQSMLLCKEKTWRWIPKKTCLSHSNDCSSIPCMCWSKYLNHTMQAFHLEISVNMYFWLWAV